MLTQRSRHALDRQYHMQPSDATKLPEYVISARGVPLRRRNWLGKLVDWFTELRVR